MRLRSLFAIAIVSALATACSAIVAGQFSDTNDYSVPDKCALTAPNAVNRCATCISDRCKSHVEYTCQTGATTKAAFDALKSCATHPYEKYGEAFNADAYGCSKYDKPDAQPIQADDDTAKMRGAELCVRDECLSGPSPACRLCPVRAEKPRSSPGSPVDYAALGSNECGKCLEDNCNDVIVECCTTDTVQEVVEMCAYIADETFKQKCQTLAILPDAGGPGDTTASNSRKCAYDMSKCYIDKCASVCPK